MTGILNAWSRGALALLGAAALYASFGVPIRILDTWFGHSTQAAARFAVAAAILAGITVWQGSRVALHQLLRERFWPALGLAAAVSAEVVFFTAAVTRTTLANTVFLLYAGTIVTSLAMGALLFGEHMTATKAVATAIALTGLATYAGSLAALSTGVLAGLAAGICNGAANGLRRSLKKADRGAVLLIQYGFGSLIALLIAVLLGERLVHPAGAGVDIVWPLLVAVVFGAALVGLGYLLLYGFGHCDLSAGTILLTTEIGFAVLFGWLLYGEIPSVTEAIGGVLVFAAAIVAVLDSPESTAESPGASAPPTAGHLG
ncbi:MAG: EamA family transporter [Mycobacteriales bacterium]